METKKMTNCPRCQKPILCEGHFTSFTQFNIKCPWCQVVLKIVVQPKISAEILKSEETKEKATANDPTSYPLPLKKMDLDAEKIFKALNMILAIIFSAYQLS